MERAPLSDRAPTQANNAMRSTGKRSDESLEKCLSKGKKANVVTRDAIGAQKARKKNASKRADPTLSNITAAYHKKRKSNGDLERPSSSMEDRVENDAEMPVPPRIVIDVLAHRARQRQAIFEEEARIEDGNGDTTARPHEAKRVRFEPEV